jgi:hypothetical protein
VHFGLLSDDSTAMYESVNVRVHVCARMLPTPMDFPRTMLPQGTTGMYAVVLPCVRDQNCNSYSQNFGLPTLSE